MSDWRTELRKARLALERCDREQAEIARDAEIKACPAYLVTLGFEDWECEKRFIAQEFHDSLKSPGAGTAGSSTR